MKIEFIKKSDLDGVWYYTTVDGVPVSGSYKTDYNEAFKIFNEITLNEGRIEKKEVLFKVETPSKQ